MIRQNRRSHRQKCPVGANAHLSAGVGGVVKINTLCVRFQNRGNMPAACTLLTAVLFTAGGLISFAQVQSAELSVEVRVSPRLERPNSNWIFSHSLDQCHGSTSLLAASRVLLCLLWHSAR